MKERKMRHMKALALIGTVGFLLTSPPLARAVDSTTTSILLEPFKLAGLPAPTIDGVQVTETETSGTETMAVETMGAMDETNPPSPPSGGGSTNVWVWQKVNIPYTLHVLTPTNPPVIYQTDNAGDMIFNMATNEVCYLETSTNTVEGPWTIVAPVTNAEVVNVPPTLPQQWFRLQLITSRFYVQWLPAPDGDNDMPSEMVLCPEWSIPQGVFYIVTNPPTEFGCYSNTIISVTYPAWAETCQQAWPIANVIELDYYPSGWSYITNQVIMPAGYNCREFQVSYIITPASGVQPHQVDPCSPLLTDVNNRLWANYCGGPEAISLSKGPITYGGSNGFGPGTPPYLPPSGGPIGPPPASGPNFPVGNGPSPWTGPGSSGIDYSQNWYGIIWQLTGSGQGFF
jgi:hypothetical protein